LRVNEQAFAVPLKGPEVIDKLDACFKVNASRAVRR
jgi:hypothetical protein